jgi:hypothetical protein
MVHDVPVGFLKTDNIDLNDIHSNVFKWVLILVFKISYILLNFSCTDNI